MKKTLLVLFSIGTISAAFAQDGRYHNDRDNARDVVLGRNEQRSVYNDRSGRDDRNGWYNLEYRKRDEIERVSRDYDRRIAAIEYDPYLRTKEKRRELKRLQREKEDAIRDINRRYARLASEERAANRHNW